MRCPTLAILALFTLHSSLVTLPAAVPLRWTVETSRAQVAQFEAYRGETLDLEAEMKSYGRPLATPVQPSLYWQTNGMGAAWWTAPATASGNVLRATWSPTNDCGGTVYSCFIGGPDATYRAAFRLRMLPSPGYTPNHLPLPTVKDESDPVFSAWLATNWPITKWTITDGTNTITAAGDATSAGIGKGYWMVRLIPDGEWRRLVPVLGSDGVLWRDSASNSYVANGLLGAPDGMWAVSVDDLSRILYIPAERYDGFSDSNAEGHYVPDRKTLATVDQIPTTPEQVGAAPASLAETVHAWQTYWGGDDVRITVTNYYGSIDLPAVYIEQKMDADDDHSENWFKIIWDERTRWNAFLSDYAAVTNEVAQNKADRAWGVYDSSSGEYSPDGLLQLSQDQIVIASGMAYQKTVTAGGCSVWVLKSTTPTTVSGELENGYFRIQDGDGNPLFEIVKGDKRVVGAVATDVQASGGAMTVRYNSVSDEHPTMEVCTDLRTADWQTEDACTVARVTWSGSSGAWVATVTPVGAPSAMFAKASYEAGGNTYIRNHVASSLDKVVVGGTEYTVTVQTVNGKKLLVLE